MIPALASAALGALLGRPFQWDGQLQARNTNAPNVYSGSGVPTAVARQGDLYYRVDSSDAGATLTHEYYYRDAAHGGPGWIGIA